MVCTVLFCSQRDQLRARGSFHTAKGTKDRRREKEGGGRAGKGLHDALFLSALERDGPRS